jgi:hypothetical protein
MIQQEIDVEEPAPLPFVVRDAPLRGAPHDEEERGLDYPPPSP